MKNFFILLYLLVFSNTIYATQWERVATGRSGFGENDTIAISPHNPNMLYFTDADWLYQSKDGGEQWEQLETTNVEGVINGIVINPQNTAIIYLTTHDDSTVRIFKSEDDGISWVKKYENTGYLIQLRINPYNPDILYFLNYGFLKSVDGGDNWENALPSPYSPSFIAVNPQNPNTLYLSTNDSPFSGGTRGYELHKSVDQGQTWVLKTFFSSVLQEGNLPIAIDPHHPNTLYVSEEHYNPPREYEPRISKSTDGGETWETIHHIAADNIVIDPHNPEIVYLGARTGLYRSANGGKTWTELSTELSSKPNIRALVINPHHPEILFVGVQNSGLYRVITDSDCVATYHLAQNTVNIPCLRIDNDNNVLNVELTGRESDLRFDVSDVQVR
ncbi:BNR/Asp-box repeat protein [Beggiatoa alba B18LD]|uniref:BNR/Asp-box repeat protein n=1 Tax=Beggiatoa alba B18LD TaxID=395493 RepID=I3CKE9_9GAMM|nr:sialidase family protein [Beggiatoa alba]EIJ44092.1 BNR/Asp-box repeat protein [Beggiatoa alba B18LD]